MKIAYIGLAILTQETKEVTPLHVTLEYFKGTPNEERERIAKEFLNAYVGEKETWVILKKGCITKDSKLGGLEVELTERAEKYFKGIIPHVTMFAYEPYHNKDAYKLFDGSLDVNEYVVGDLAILYAKPAVFGYDNKPIFEL